MPKKSAVTLSIFILLLLLGFVLRMVDLTDPPIDFHPTRQFRGALIARGLYYQHFVTTDPDRQEIAVELTQGLEEFEPPILEYLVVFVYWIIGGEYLWVARVFSSLFWVGGGAALYFLIRRSVGTEAALVGLFYYLFLPFSVYSSRSFQPDPFMVMWLLLAMTAAFRWMETQSWKFAALTAVFAGISVLVKVVAAYLVGGMMVALIVPALLKKERINLRQVAAIAGVMVLIPAAYYLINIQDSSSTYIQNWVIALLPLIKQKVFWVLWYKRLKNLLLIPAVLAALVGIFFAKPVHRRMLIGLWVGYFLYGLTLPHQVSTHSYYHIQLIPIIAFSFAPLVQWGYRRIVGGRRVLANLFYTGLLLASLLLGWMISQNLLEDDYRHEPPYWETIGEVVPDDGESIGLVQYYGFLLKYYGWDDVKLWPESAEQRLAELRGSGQEENFEAYFQKLVAGKDYFVAINLKDFERQKELNSYLHENYPVLDQGSGYILFDLRTPPE